MKSLLSELYNGEIYPDEQICPANPEYRKLNRKLTEEFESFQDKLTKEDYQRLDDLLSLQGESSSMEQEQSFIFGFKLGAMLMVEVFTGMDELFRK